MVCLPCAETSRANEPASQSGFEVLHYTARLDPDLSGNTLRGSEKISLVFTAAGVRDIGFDAGRLNEACARVGGVALRFLSQDLQPEPLQRLSANTGDRLKFFGDRAGIPYRGKYEQALVTETIGQELAGFSLLSEAYGRDVLEKSAAEDPIAHEAAHQWWGIMVTCRSLNDFWLNEGFANFMAAACMQHRHGDAVYQQIVERWRQRVERLVVDGANHPPVYSQWINPSRDDRAVVYRKAAYVLHLLRGQLGKHDFWKGRRDYSREFWGKSVTTADFKGAMERSSGRNLDAFFQRWVASGISDSRLPAASVPSTVAYRRCRFRVRQMDARGIQTVPRAIDGSPWSFILGSRRDTA